MSSKWPKILPPLTSEQKVISDDFMKLWHEVFPEKFGVIEKFNQNFPERHSRAGFKTTLEIGAGLGEHLHYEKLTLEQEKNYYALELRKNMASQIQKDFPNIHVVVGDCQERLPFEDHHFDRILAIHVLEHLPNLPACIREAYRVLNKSKGQFLVVIPCEGGLAYNLARKMSAERIYKKHYGGSYKWFYSREHINLPKEIMEELAPYFDIQKQQFFPFSFFPLLSANLCIGLELVPRPVPFIDHRSL